MALFSWGSTPKNQNGDLPTSGGSSHSRMNANDPLKDGAAAATPPPLTPPPLPPPPTSTALAHGGGGGAPPVSTQAQPAAKAGTAELAVAAVTSSIAAVNMSPAVSIFNPATFCTPAQQPPDSPLEEEQDLAFFETPAAIADDWSDDCNNHNHDVYEDYDNHNNNDDNNDDDSDEEYPPVESPDRPDHSLPVQQQQQQQKQQQQHYYPYSQQQERSDYYPDETNETYPYQESNSMHPPVPDQYEDYSQQQQHYHYTSTAATAGAADADSIEASIPAVTDLTADLQQQQNPRTLTVLLEEPNDPTAPPPPHQQQQQPTPSSNMHTTTHPSHRGLDMIHAPHPCQDLATPLSACSYSSTFTFLSDADRVPAELSQTVEHAVRRRREFQSSMHDLECRVAALTAAVAEESMDRCAALQDLADRQFDQPLENLVERVALQREAQQVHVGACQATERNVSLLDSQMTHSIHVRLQDVKRQQLDSLQDALENDIVTNGKIQAAAADKQEVSLARQFESLVGHSARRYQEERAARIANLQVASEQMSQTLDDLEPGGVDECMATIQELRAQLQQEKTTRETDDARVMELIHQRAAAMKRALLEAVGDFE